MKRYIFRFILLLILASLQFIVQPDWMPDFILIVVIYYSLRFGVMSGQLTGFFGGLIQDLIFQLENIGIFMITKLIIGFILGLLSKRIYHRSVISVIVITFFVTLVNSGFEYLAKMLFITNYKDISNMVSIWLVRIPLTAILAPLLFWLLDKFEGKTEVESIM